MNGLGAKWMPLLAAAAGGIIGLLTLSNTLRFLSVVGILVTLGLFNPAVLLVLTSVGVVLTGGLSVKVLSIKPADLLILILLAEAAILTQRRDRQGGAIPYARPVLLFIAVALFLSLLNSFGSSTGDLSHTFTSAVRLTGAWLVVLAVPLVVQSRTAALRVIKAVVLVTAVSAALGLLAYYGILTTPLTPETGGAWGGTVAVGGSDMLVGGHRLTATFTNPNVAAPVLLTGGALAFGLGEAGRRKWERVLWYGLAGMHAVAILLTYSRSGYLGIAGLVLTYVVVRRRWWLLLASLLPALAAPTVLYRFLQTFSNGVLDSSSAARLQLWSEGMGLFEKHMLFGIGFGHYSLFSGALSHSLYITVLTELGLVGSAVLLYAGWRIVQTFWTQRRAEPLMPVMLALTVGLLLFSVTGESWLYSHEASMVYAVAVGLVTVFVEGREANASSTHGRRNEHPYTTLGSLVETRGH